MSLFKGLFYLSEPADRIERDPHYGADAGAGEFRRELGNHTASELWFGRHDFGYEEALIARAATCGGCA